MPIGAGFSERIIRYVAIRGDSVRCDGIGSIRAVENPPTATAAPINPSVAGRRISLRLPDGKKRSGVGQTVVEPERLGFAVASVLRFGQTRRIGAVGIA